MSIFKTIGTKLKRVVSLNNLTKAITGNFTGIGQDVVRVMTTKSPSEIKKGLVSTEQVVPAFTIPPEVNTIIASKETQYKSAVSSKLAENTAVQNVSHMLSKTYLNAMWLKHKNFIIGLGATLVLVLIGWKILKKPSVNRARRKR